MTDHLRELRSKPACLQAGAAQADVHKSPLPPFCKGGNCTLQLCKRGGIAPSPFVKGVVWRIPLCKRGTEGDLGYAPLNHRRMVPSSPGRGMG